MTFEQLYYFSEVYRQRSISRAADNLYISRQAISTVIRKLEEEYQVQLFHRLPNGVVPTLAATELFQSAKIILDERIVLNQKMAYHANETKLTKSYMVSMPEALTATCGDRLLQQLSTMFPYAEFSFSTVLAKDVASCYKNFDIMVAFMSEKDLAAFTACMDKTYICRVLHDMPMYIWCANSSPLNNFSEISFDVLKKYPYCVLKNIYDYTLFTKNIYENTDRNPVISIEKIFCDNIQYHNYYTSDCCLGDGKPFYEELFKDKPIQLRAIHEAFYIVFICRSELEDHYTIFADFLNESLFP